MGKIKHKLLFIEDSLKVLSSQSLEHRFINAKNPVYVAGARSIFRYLNEKKPGFLSQLVKTESVF